MWQSDTLTDGQTFSILIANAALSYVVRPNWCLIKTKKLSHTVHTAENNPVPSREGHKLCKPKTKTFQLHFCTLWVWPAPWQFNVVGSMQKLPTFHGCRQAMQSPHAQYRSHSSIYQQWVCSAWTSGLVIFFSLIPLFLSRLPSTERHVLWSSLNGISAPMPARRRHFHIHYRSCDRRCP